MIRLLGCAPILFTLALAASCSDDTATTSPEVDASTNVDSSPATSKDSSTAPSDASAPESAADAGSSVAQVSSITYGADAGTATDISFVLSAPFNTGISSLESIAVQFTGSGAPVATFETKCSDLPWTVQAGKSSNAIHVQVERSSGAATLKFPCGATTISQPLNSGVGSGGQVKLTLSGVLANSTPWSVAGSGNAR